MTISDVFNVSRYSKDLYEIPLRIWDIWKIKYTEALLQKSVFHFQFKR